MAAIEKIGEGVFLISHTNFSEQPFETVVNIEEISQSFQLNYTPATRFNQLTSLTIQFAPFSSTVPKPTFVLAIRNGVKKKMQNQNNSSWTITFAGTCVAACTCGNMYAISSVFEIIINFNSTPPTESKEVLNHLLNLWETKTLSDVTFKFKGKEVKAHRLILASGSPVLAAMFQHDFKEKKEGIVEIKDVKSHVFETMLRFIYTGAADLKNVDVEGLLVAADRYGVDSLKVKCGSYLERNLTLDNVISYLVVSHLYQVPKLRKKSLDFIAQNAESIVATKDWEDLMRNYLELGLEAVRGIAMDKNKTRLEENVNYSSII